MLLSDVACNTFGMNCAILKGFETVLLKINIF